MRQSSFFTNYLVQTERSFLLLQHTQNLNAGESKKLPDKALRSLQAKGSVPEKIPFSIREFSINRKNLD